MEGVFGIGIANMIGIPRAFQDAKWFLVSGKSLSVGWATLSLGCCASCYITGGVCDRSLRPDLTVFMIVMLAGHDISCSLRPVPLS